MRKFTLAVLALCLVTSMAARGQKAAAADASGDAPEQQRPYHLYAGVAETSQNQLVHAHGFLLGYQIALTRDFGKYFAVTAEGASFMHSLSSNNFAESGYSPNVAQILAGPEIHSPLFGHLAGSLHILAGGSHTGGGGIVHGNPGVSFAYGYGAGLEYTLSPHWSIRLSGDDIHASFVQGAPENTPHAYSDAQSSIGLSYRFSDWRFRR